MILAAGRGERMRPLTDTLPKPLLPAGGVPLLQYHLEKLARAGVEKVVINYARLGAMIADRFGDGRAYGVDIVYSDEGDSPLETGGGIKKALPLLGGAEPFIIVNADIWTDYDFKRLQPPPSALAHLVLVANPDHHPQGDFALVDGRVTAQAAARYTYSGIAVIRPGLVADCRADSFPLGPLLYSAADRGELTGELHPGLWFDIGTPERLARLDKRLRGQKID